MSTSQPTDRQVSLPLASGHRLSRSRLYLHAFPKSVLPQLLEDLKGTRVSAGFACRILDVPCLHSASATFLNPSLLICNYACSAGCVLSSAVI